jgi:multiple sugar transport system substrate-binding protein
MVHKKAGALALLAALLMSGSAIAQDKRVLNYYADFDPIPLAAFEALIADFETANPEVDVVLQNFDHEGYKTAIRNFLTTDSPDLANWYAGNRMAPFVSAGQFQDVSDVWEANGLGDSLASAKASMTIDGKQWGVPYTYYQWGIYFNRDAYKAAGVEAPGPEGVTWDVFVANCEKFKAAGIDCLTTGTKALWPGAGIFDYMSLRTNGYEWHMDLTAGKVAWTDQKVKDVFAQWAKVQPYITANHAALEWEDAAALLVQGKAANYVMGNFAVGNFKQGGMTNDNLGFMVFPEITPGIPRSEDAPTDTIHIPSGAKNVADAKLFLAFVANADVQTKLNTALSQLPTNKNSTVPQDDPFLVAGFQALSSAHALSQFFDRDAPAEMAKAGMEGFQEFMVKPENLDAILDRLEKVRAKAY